MRIKLFVILSVMMLAVFTCHAQSADRCADVLRSGIFNENRSFNQSNYSSKLKDALCQSADSSSGSSSGGGGSLSYGLFSAGGQYNQQHAQALKQMYCHQGSSDLSSSDVNWMMQRIASQYVLDAWSRCMEGPAHSGLVGRIDDVNGANFNFKVRWIPAFGVNSTTATSFAVKGASCDPVIIANNVRIGTEEMTQPCTRNGHEGVSVVVNTDHGSAVGTLPEVAAQSVPPPKTTKDNCMEGSATACSSLASQLLPTCGFDAACRARAQCWSDKSRAFVLVKQSCPANITAEQQQQCEQFKQTILNSHSQDCDDL